MLNLRFPSFLDWSVKVGRPFGIPVRLHITILFFLLPAFRGGGLGFALGLEYALGIAFSILVHELGHALTAKRYGLTGLSIMLHGFGGFASSAGPRTPGQALRISLAGPGATFALGLSLLGIGALGMRAELLSPEVWQQFALIGALGRINILLGFLNLVPILPWDGGQALQALLAHRMSEVKAMRAVAHLGLVLSPPLLIFGFLSGGFYGLFALVGLVTSYSILTQTGGIRFGELFAERRSRREMEEIRQREAARQEAYRDEVSERERERAEKERLRRILEGPSSDL